jgi:hypothetical protein
MLPAEALRHGWPVTEDAGSGFTAHRGHDRLCAGSGIAKTMGIDYQHTLLPRPRSFLPSSMQIATFLTRLAAEGWTRARKDGDRSSAFDTLDDIEVRCHVGEDLKAPCPPSEEWIDSALGGSFELEWGHDGYPGLMPVNWPFGDPSPDDEPGNRFILGRYQGYALGLTVTPESVLENAERRYGQVDPYAHVPEIQDDRVSSIVRRRAIRRRAEERSVLLERAARLQEALPEVKVRQTAVCDDSSMRPWALRLLDFLLDRPPAEPEKRWEVTASCRCGESLVVAEDTSRFWERGLTGGIVLSTRCSSCGEKFDPSGRLLEVHAEADAEALKGGGFHRFALHIRTDRCVPPAADGERPQVVPAFRRLMQEAFGCEFDELRLYY